MDAAIIERLGVAGIVVVAAYFLVRYFISVVAKKDEAINQLTERFIHVTERFATATENNTHRLEGVQESIEKVTSEFRSALGDAIVRAAHEAMVAARRGRGNAAG